jgi:hypothetical protein
MSGGFGGAVGAKHLPVEVGFDPVVVSDIMYQCEAVKDSKWGERESGK